MPSERVQRTIDEVLDEAGRSGIPVDEHPRTLSSRAGAGARNGAEPRPEALLGPLTATGWLLLILANGLVLRLALSSFGSFVYDAALMRLWAVRLVTQPLAQFYATPELAENHLPGDMWILKLVATIFHAFSPAMAVDQPAFLFLLKLVPAVADVGVAVMLYFLARHFSSAAAGLVAAASFMFNPASIFLTSIWGQWDSVSAFFVLASFWLMLRRKPELSFLSLTYSTLIKPQFLVFSLPLISVFIVQYILPHPEGMGTSGNYPREGLRRSLYRLLFAAVACLALALVILLPFGVGIAPLPYRWSLFERLAYSMNYFKYIVMGAFNVWAILLSSMPDFTLDNGKWLFGLTFETLGAIASAVIYCIIMLIYWTKRDSKALIWSCLAISLTLFMVPTRMHERYLFVGVVFAELIAVIFPRLWWCYGLLTLTYLSNLYWVYNYYYPTMRLDWLYSSAVFVHLIAVINLGLFLYVLVGMGGVVGGGGIDQKRAARALRAKWGRRRLVAAG